MSGETILFEVDGHVATVTLNRPHRLNALSDTLLGELERAVDAVAADEGVRVLVIKGAGRAFSAGYDVGGDSEEIGYAHERSPVEDRNRQLANIDLFLKLWRLPIPVIAQVHGYCMAGATQLCVFTDITVVAEDAVIAASPAVPIGGGFISPLWATLTNVKRAKLMSFDAGHRIDGITAAQWGWATEAVPADVLDAHVARLARSIARTPRDILQIKKEGANRVADLQQLTTIARMGTETDALLHLTPEVKALQDDIVALGLKGAIAKFNGVEA
jgi:enoyl-CoA hydratase/carnithine racemase